MAAMCIIKKKTKCIVVGVEDVCRNSIYSIFSL